MLCKYPGERGDEPWRPVSPNLGRHLISTIPHRAFSITPRWIGIVPEGMPWQHNWRAHHREKSGLQQAWKARSEDSLRNSVSLYSPPCWVSSFQEHRESVMLRVQTFDCKEGSFSCFMERWNNLLLFKSTIITFFFPFNFSLVTKISLFSAYKSFFSWLLLKTNWYYRFNLKRKQISYKFSRYYLLLLINTSVSVVRC